MDKHFVLSKIKDYEAHLDNVAPLMESDDQLIMNELIREINNTCHVKIRGFEYSARDCAPQPLKLSVHSGGIEHPCRRR